MKKIIMIMALSLVMASANVKILEVPKKVAEMEIHMGLDIQLNIFCYNGIEWIYLHHGRRGGLAKNEEPVDRLDASKGTQPIFCRE